MFHVTFRNFSAREPVADTGRLGTLPGVLDQRPRPTGARLRAPTSWRSTMTTPRARLRRRTVPVAIGFLAVLLAAGPAAAGPGNGPGNGHGGKVNDQVVTTTQQKGQVAALTFDDGPNPLDTPRLLEVLRENHVKALFCLWG